MTLYLLLASYGACFGLMNEKLPVLNRALYKLPFGREEQGNFFQRMFGCSYCTGFHTGWVIYAFGVLFGAAPVVSGVYGVVLFGFASSAFCYLFDAVMQRLEQ